MSDGTEYASLLVSERNDLVGMTSTEGISSNLLRSKSEMSLGVQFREQVCLGLWLGEASTDVYCLLSKSF